MSGYNVDFVFNLVIVIWNLLKQDFRLGILR